MIRVSKEPPQNSKPKLNQGFVVGIVQLELSDININM